MGRYAWCTSLLLGFAFLPTWLPAADKCERLVATGNPEYPPYLWRDPKNPKQLVGANADLLERIGSELGLTIEVIYTGPWSRAQHEVRTGRVDLLAGAFLTMSRLDSMDYIHPAVYETSSVVWVRKGQAFAYGGWNDLRGRSGRTLVNNSFGQAFDTFAQENLQLEAVPSLNQAFRMLQLERSEYVVYEQYPGLALARRMNIADQLEVLSPPVSSEGLFLALSHDSACNGPWLRGQLAKKMTELSAAGLPQVLLQRNLQRWEEEIAQAASESTQ
jgi:polar amino acid transport system substrate-binding protein